MADPARILPALDPLNRSYWTGGEGGALCIARCESCGFYTHPPGPRCRRCRSASVVPVAVSGRGTIAAFSVNEQAWLPQMPVPFVLAAVELAEQPELYVMTNIVGCPAASVRIGMPVHVTFEQHEDVYLPMFRPAAP